MDPEGTRPVLGLLALLLIVLARGGLAEDVTTESGDGTSNAVAGPTSDTQTQAENIVPTDAAVAVAVAVTVSDTSDAGDVVATEALGGVTDVPAGSTPSGEQVVPHGGDVTVTSGDVTSAVPEEEDTAAVVTSSQDVVSEETKPKMTYKVTSIPVIPYLFVNSEDGGYTGYIQDVLDRFKEILDVEFSLKIVTDGKFGTKLADGQWTGMIGEIIRGEADLAAAPITVTVLRDEVVDFTHPIFRYSAAAVIGFRSQGSHMRTLENLLDEGFKFAVTENSNIHKFLAGSTRETDKAIMANILAHNGLKSSNNQGVGRARYDSKYAFLLESGSADWVSHQEPCNLAIIPTDIYKRTYAFVIKNRSELRDIINRAIVKMEEKDEFNRLQDKWFHGGNCNGCDVIAGGVYKMAALLCLSMIHHVFWA